MDKYVISDFLDRLHSCEAGEPTWEEIETHFMQLGFDNITFGIINKATSNVEGMFSNVSEDWMTYYIDQGFILDDPFAGYVASNERDYVVTERSIGQFIETASSRAMEVYLGGAEVGVKSAFLSPYHHAHKDHIVGFNLGSNKDTKEFEFFIADKRDNVIQSTALAQAFMQKFTSDRSDHKSWYSTTGNAKSLSPREIEVLNWLAAGHRVDRIADRMTISNDTVNFHIKSIKRKLNAKTREHAVAIGFIDKIIR